MGFSRLRTGSLKRAPRWPTRARSAESCRARNPGVPACFVRRRNGGRQRNQPSQWPTSVTHFAKVTYLRPPTRLFYSPTLRRLGLCCDRSKPPEAETWNSLAHALTEFRIGKRILVDDLRSFRRRRSKHVLLVCQFVRFSRWKNCTSASAQVQFSQRKIERINTVARHVLL